MKTHVMHSVCVLLILSLLLSLSACELKPVQTTDPAEFTPPPASSEPSASPAPEQSGTEQTGGEKRYAESFFVLINELMPSNKSTLADRAGFFPDWLELYNYGSDAVDMTGCRLSLGGDSWSFPSCRIDAGGYLVVFFGKDSPELLCTGFKLPKEGGTVTLSTPDGLDIDLFSYGACEGDESLYRDENGSLVKSVYPTPGYENTQQGYELFAASHPAAGPLVINEAMTYNEWYYSGEFDWVELKNISNESVSLSDYYLSDKGSDRALYRLPDKTLAPGEVTVIHCVEDNTDYAGAPFALSSDSESLFLSYKDGSLRDYMHLRDIRYHGSFGRLSDGGHGFFDTPTPGSDNGFGSCTYAAKPVPSVAPGVYDGCEGFALTLSADGTIHYTLDGSTPTVNSPVYSEPIPITKTSVVRAISVQDGKLQSDSADLSYIINENHELPVVSLVADPEDIFGSNGVYTHYKMGWENRGSVTLFDGDDGFSIRCGIKMHGLSSLEAQDKKSMKLTFRPRYESELHYDLFGNGVTTFSSVLLRAAQEDYYSTQMHDNLMHQIALGFSSDLPAQDYKYCVLYINGAYWGLYNFREAHSDAHYANHYGYDEDTVTQWKEQWPSDSKLQELYNYAAYRDIRGQEAFDYICSIVDVNSVIDWTIIQAYSANFDIHSPNMRFYMSTEDGIFRYALVDLDLSMFRYDTFDPPLNFGYAYNDLARYLLRNEQFAHRFVERLSLALNSSMSNESVLALIDSMADEIRGEIPRDRERWGGSLENWEKMVQDMRNFVTYYNGRAKLMINGLKQYVGISDADYQTYFGNVK